MARLVARKITGWEAYVVDPPMGLNIVVIAYRRKRKSILNH